MVRILHVLGGLGKGGAENMVMNLYRNIDRKSIQFDFVIYEDGLLDYYDEIIQLGGNVFFSPHYNGINTLEYSRFWVNLLKNHHEYPIIHGHVRSTATIYLLIAKKMHRITIAHSHSVSNGQGFTAYIKRILQLPIPWISDYQIACSKEAAIWLFGSQILERNTFLLLPNAIDAAAYEFNNKMRILLRKKWGLEKKFVICNVGRFVYPKNHDFIIEIFELLLQKCPNAFLLLVGGGEREKEIQELVNKKNLNENVHFGGVRSDIPQILWASDLFLFPSRYEGLGMVAVEAQAAGLQVVCSDTVPDSANITVYMHKLPLNADPSIWVNEIVKYANGYERISTRKQIESAGYDIAITSQKMQEFYLQLLKE